MNEFPLATVLLVLLAVTLTVLDVRMMLYTENLRLRQFARHIVYLGSALVLYAFIGWVVTLPLPPVADIVLLFSHTVPSSGTQHGLFTYVALAFIVVIAFYTGGLVDYIVHRWFSHSPAFWWSHEYHHAPRVVMLLMPGIAVRPFAFFLTIPTVFTMLVVYTTLFTLAQVPHAFYPTILLLLLLQATILIVSHSLTCRHVRVLHKLLKPFGITTPQEHILHHGAELRGNYANLTTLWDRLLGTYLDPDLYDLATIPIGLPYTQDFFGAVSFGVLRPPKRFLEVLGVYRYTNRV